MQLRSVTTVTLLSISLLLIFISNAHAHNITRLLADHPEFSTFNHYLSLTHLAGEINSHTTITVCAVDNAAMSDLLSTHPSIYTVKNILSLHVLLDYFGAKKLHQITNGTALAATMFQATGSAPGSSGFVNITDLKGGKVGFSPEDNNNQINTYFVKSVKEIPYNISVIQISKVLPSDVAAAPAPGPAETNITAVMSAHGCKVFADTLIADVDAEKTFESSAEGGLTVFCPVDDAFKAFLPKYKNLTAARKTALLEYHGVPVYQSMAMLKSNNGVMNTLATDGASKFDFTVQNDGMDVTLKTKVVTAKITGTLIDEQPIAIYTVDKVLLPKELFKAQADTPAPAPAPDVTADSPKPSTKKSKKAPSPSDEADTPSPADDAAGSYCESASVDREQDQSLSMIVKRIAPTKPIINLIYHHHHHHHLHLLSTNRTHTPQPSKPITTISPPNPDHLLRVCTILYQQQDSPDPRLHSKLHACQSQFDQDNHLTLEFFLQVCNKFPYSWRPVYRFFQYTEANSHSHFTHTSVSFNKLLDVIGKSCNIELFWELLHEMGRRRLVNEKTFRIALNTLAAARELKRCVEFFHSMNACGYEYSLETLNKVVETLCGNGLVEEAKFVVSKLKEWIKPSGVTYKCLIQGFCDVGDLVEASKVWNLMVDEGFQPDIDAVEKMMESLFKINRYDEALKLFQMMRTKRIDDLGLSTYRLVIEWMCKRGKIAQAYMLFEEMHERGAQADNLTLGSLIYGLLARGRVREAYRIVEGIEKPDINVYHGLIKGLLKLRRASEATQVFREMIKRGCEPTMHTYIMLLQGHLGKRGRKGTDPLVNFETIFVGGLVKAGKSLEATKYVERSLRKGLEVPRFDYNKFLKYYSNEEGVVMFEDVAKKLREVGSVDLADIFERYGQRMATRDRRRNRAVEL